jgi:F-type H+-transporting ATPase subunit b
MLDWFTIVAQIFNFLLLVFLLQRFLYKPILKAIAAREERIANTVADADRAKADAQEQIEEYRLKNEAWEKERELMVQDARHEIDELRKELLGKVHHDVEVAKEMWNKGLQQEKEAFLHRLRLQVSHQTYQVARQVLSDLAEVELEQHIIAVFIKRLELLDAQELARLISSIEGTDGVLLVRSAFDLPQENRLPILSALAAKLDCQPTLEFETTSDIMYGIELRSNGYKLSWNVGDYLQVLEDALEEQIAGKAADSSRRGQES